LNAACYTERHVPDGDFFRGRKAFTKCGTSTSDALRRNPTTGIAGCCARAASGHAAAPPSVAKNFGV
jgi:hypothetical protein